MFTDFASFDLLTVLEFSQFEGITVEKCLEKFIKPLYQEEVVAEIIHILLEENSNNDEDWNLKESVFYVNNK